MVRDASEQVEPCTRVRRPRIQEPVHHPDRQWRRPSADRFGQERLVFTAPPLQRMDEGSRDPEIGTIESLDRMEQDKGPSPGVSIGLHLVAESVQSFQAVNTGRRESKSFGWSAQDRQQLPRRVVALLC